MLGKIVTGCACDLRAELIGHLGSEIVFFFSSRGRHTICGRDWSSDVCSSDLCLRGLDMGVISDAGCPGIADPGARIVHLAHQHGIEVKPLVGPSSILLGMMASGLNGQNFAFNGYLPINNKERREALKQLEKLSKANDQTQLFIETPYRNNQMLESILSALHPMTQLCIACDLTLETQYIKTTSVSEWAKIKVDLQKRPTIFIIQAYY